MSLARPFASSLEALSACDMKTIHAIADPHLRVELRTHGQYCGPMNSTTEGGTKKGRKKGRGTKKRRLGGDGRDYFEDYCDSVFPGWDSCKKLAMTLVDADDGELHANIEAYCDASTEDELYSPFEILANRVFRRARQHVVDAPKPSSHHIGGVPAPEASMSPKPLLNLVAAPAHDRPVMGCAGDRQ